MKSKRFLFWAIILITIVASLIVSPYDILPAKIPLKVNPPFHLGLDLQGGTSLTLEAEMKDINSQDRKDALESAKTVIERRVNFHGVGEPDIQTARIGES